MPPQTEPLTATDAEIAAIAWNADGLVPAIVQDATSGRVLMLAWMNEDALRTTFAEGRMVYWSRRRAELWRKGDTSGDVQWVREAYYDCDGDTLLFVVDQAGRGACHTGEPSCFFRGFGSGVRPGPV
jgi:phosphoribosyl-AMP cyclohydrolase